MECGPCGAGSGFGRWVVRNGKVSKSQPSDRIDDRPDVTHIGAGIQAVPKSFLNLNRNFCFLKNMEYASFLK